MSEIEQPRKELTAIKKYASFLIPPTYLRTELAWFGIVMGTTIAVANSGHPHQNELAQITVMGGKTIYLTKLFRNILNEVQIK